jgi:LAS superfamily LD-carboxypeptidase LdcB
MSVRSRTLTLLTALPLLTGVTATAADAATTATPAPTPVVAPTAPAPELITAATASTGWGGYSNGYIPASVLCAIPWQGVDHLRCDAAKKFTALNTAYKAKFGANICVNDAYRSYAKQVQLYKLYGSPRAAVPGTSNHGWAIAVDLGCGVGTFGNARHTWFATNAPKYNWKQPSWAVQGGSNPEAWHWQYFGAYTTVSTPATTKAASTTTIAVTGTWPRVATATVRNKATGKALVGAAVTIKRRATSTTTWTTVGTYKTNTAGQVAYRYSPNTPTAVNMSYAGTSSTASSAAGVTLTTPTVLSLQVSPGWPDRITGSLRTPGGTGIGAQTVLLQRRPVGSSTWTTVATLRTPTTGQLTATVEHQRRTEYRLSYAGVAKAYVASTSATVSARRR